MDSNTWTHLCWLTSEDCHIHQVCADTLINESIQYYKFHKQLLFFLGAVINKLLLLTINPLVSWILIGYPRFQEFFKILIECLSFISLLALRHQLYGHLPPITKTIQVRRIWHAGQCRRSRDELKSNVLLWIPTYGRAKAGRPARTYIQQLCDDTECSPEDLPEAMNNREKWRERARDIRASGTTWWGWWVC